MVDKISLSELEALIVSEGGTGAPNVQHYFLEQPNPENPFDPIIIPDPDKVDLTPVAGPPGEAEAQRALVMKWVVAAEKKSRLKRFEKMRRLKPEMKIVVSEGDSWTQYPVFLEDIVINLMPKWNVLSLDEAGDVLSRMLRQREFERAIQEVKPSSFLLSAGGNDVVGEGTGEASLAAHLRQFVQGAQAADLLLPSWEALVLAKLKTQYRDVINIALAAGPANMRVVIHGYDYAVPGTGSGRISRNMWARGILDQGVQCHIVKLLIDKFNDMQKSIVTEFAGRVKHADLRGSVAALGVTRQVAATFWHDEMHPKNAGFASAAARVNALLI